MPTSHSAVRLSERVRRLVPSATLAVAAKARTLQAEGHDVVAFGAGEPDFDTPDNIKQAAIEALEAGQTHYMPVPGEHGARQAIATRLQHDNGIVCTADDVIITAGAKHAIYLALQCLLDYGGEGEVIVPTPAWVSYRPIVELAGGRVIEVPGALDNDYKITAQQLRRAITPSTAVLLLNSPSNPCGTMYGPDEIKALAEVVAEHDPITIISDEIYDKLVYGDDEHLSPGSIDAVADRVVTVNGLSKAYAMTGWRIGYACAAGGDESLVRAMAKLQGQMTSHITSFCYAAIVEALANSAASVEAMRRAFAERARLTHQRVSAMPGVRCPRPTGAFYVFPDVSAHFGKTSPGGRRIDSSVGFAEALLEDAHVALVPGAAFGECGEGHVRLSFACSTERIEEGCRRIDAWLRSLA